MSSKLKWCLSGVLAAFVLGIFVGYFRYWYGFFVLGQGLFAGLAVPFIMKKRLNSLEIDKKELREIKTSIITVSILLVFVFAQFIGFGLAQEWFEPFKWYERVLAGRTSEDVFGVALMGAAVGRPFAAGISGGFWLFLNIFDLIFMGFFVTVGINTQLENKK
jgi:hypothetical protein